MAWNNVKPPDEELLDELLEDELDELLEDELDELLEDELLDERPEDELLEDELLLELTSPPPPQPTMLADKRVIPTAKRVFCIIFRLKISLGKRWVGSLAKIHVARSSMCPDQPLRLVYFLSVSSSL